MSEPADMRVPMLREMGAELSTFRGETLKRLEAIEEAQKSFRHALSADTLMSRLLTGELSSGSRIWSEEFVNWSRMREGGI